MADLKPIGSEKLQGQDKIKRMMEIARFKETTPSSINETSKSEYSRTLSDGSNYEIVKERQGYIIKKTISESETDYIEPMKNRKYYSSYSQALKRLNLVAGELNRLNENEEGTSMFGEQKRYTLKTPTPAPIPAPMEAAVPPMAPPAVPSPELPPSPIGDEGGEDVSMDIDAEMGPEGDVEMDTDVDMEMDGGDDEQVTFKTIQKLTGKLTQKIRTLDTEEGMTSEDIKYVINMVISSLNLKSLSEEDKDDIMDKFDEDSEDMGGDDMDGEDLTDDSEVEDIQADMDIPMEGEMEETEVDEYFFSDSKDLGDFEDDEDDMRKRYKMMDKPSSDDGDYSGMRNVMRKRYDKVMENYGNGAIIDSIFGESKIDKVISKYFEITKKEIMESREKVAKKKVAKISEVRKQMGAVVKLTETIEQELASQQFLTKNSSAKIIGKTNKKNLVFENKGKQVRITPEGQIL